MLSFVLIAALAAPVMSASAPQAAAPTPTTSGPATQAAAPAPAHQEAWSRGTLEMGALAGYATGTVYDPQRSDSSFAQVLVRLGVHFGATFSGRMRGNFSIVAEGVGIVVDQQPRAAGGGLNLLIRYTWTSGRWRPSLLGGAGVVFTDEQVPPGETTHNFSPQAGVGVAYMLEPNWALSGEYRFHHLSNKGATETNPGINSHLVLFGVSWFR